jgi:hypothetical protein
MSKLIKRKDGSYSKRGLWDNIRANKGSGKKPTKEMLKQESKIKKEENMNSMYKKGGKTPKKKMMKESFMEESKEIGFDAPGVKPPKRKFDLGGIIETGMQANARQNQAEGKATMAGKKKMYKTGGAVKKYNNGGPTPSTPATKPSSEPTQKKSKLTPVSENSTNDPMSQDKFMAKKGGAKSMKPGGGGRFAAMVGKLKGQGKSEGSAEAIAASVGRKKYGKNRFQAMAAAGKKKMMGGKKC